MKHSLLSLLLLLLVSSCNISDEAKELGNGYTYVGEGAPLNYIIGSHTIYPKVVGFEFDESFIVVAQEPNLEGYKSILGTDLDSPYSSYPNYLADSASLQHKLSKTDFETVRKFGPLFSALKQKDLSPENTSNDIAIREAVADSLFHNDPYYQTIFRHKRNFWIIQKEKDVLFGPFNFQQFNQQREIMGISLKLAEE
ncbi:hypothetical protein [Hymenobacter antarcticus]|uniref:Lipoprotein n=1 Tax=Hymenobacter antarcticus TaxID=486270 RepID=A0ABP7PDA9_9BACT